jgi:hypothetical protein
MQAVKRFEPEKGVRLATYAMPDGAPSRGRAAPPLSPQGAEAHDFLGWHRQIEVRALQKVRGALRALPT